jgi:hypothetical protein
LTQSGSELLNGLDGLLAAHRDIDENNARAREFLLHLRGMAAR